jgi:hypothetical protein
LGGEFVEQAKGLLKALCIGGALYRRFAHAVPSLVQDALVAGQQELCHEY